MAASLSIIAAKDGTGTTIVGGLQALDLSGAGTGPWSLANIIVDGTSGTNRLGVNASGQITVVGSGTFAVQATVSQATASSLNATVVGTGTFAVQAAQSGTWTATVTQATAGNLNATVVGTGTFAVQATLQASATTAIGKVDPNTVSTWGLVAQGGATAPTNAMLAGGVYNSSSPTFTSGQGGSLQLTAAGSLHVTVDNTTSLGQAVMASSSPIAIASNQSTIAVAFDTSQIFDGATGTTATISKNKISVASATTTTIVTATSGKKTRILALYVIAGASVNINWQSHTTTSNTDGVQDLTANGGYVLPFNPVGWFDTTSGEALDLVTSTNAQVGGYVITAAV